MKIEYDENKNAINLDKHGVSFEMAAHFQLSSAIIEQDRRFDYGEDRFNAFGYLGERMYVLTFAIRGENIRVISFRKANKREMKRYERK